MSRVTFAFAAVLSVSCALGCAGRSPAAQRTTITSAELQNGYREAEVAAEELALGKYAEALARADNALKLAPDNPFAHHQRAAALHHLGRLEAAVTAYHQAAVHFGEDLHGKSLALYGRARALDDLGQCDEAKRAYEQYASLVRSKDPDGAEMAIAYGKACRVSPPLPSPEGPLLTEMTRALADGKHEQVLELERKMPRSATASPWVDYNLGAALLGLGRTDEAIAAFSRAERAFNDRDPWAHSVAIFGRARALESAGRCREAEQAIEEYARVVGARDPGSIRVATAYTSRCQERPTP